MTYPMFSPDKSGLLIERNGGVCYVPMSKATQADKKAAVEWQEQVAAPQPVDIAAERAAMRSSPAQMRLALHRMGLLDQVQAIADADPEASIVWEYAAQIERQSPLIEALGGENGFTDDQIDDIFRAAMAVVV